MRQSRPLWASSRLAGYANRVRAELLAMFIDALLVVLSFSMALLVRFDGAVPGSAWQSELRFLPLGVAVFVLCGWGFGLYAHVWRHASVHEARRLLESGATATGVVTVIMWWGPRLIPISVALAGGVLTTVMMGAVRYQSRMFSRRRIESEGRGLRVVIVGAGTTGAGLVRQMRDGSASGLSPVALVDDDVRMQGKQVLGVPVAGPASEIGEVLERFEAQQVIIAVPSAPAALVRMVTDAAETRGVAVRLVPELDEIVRSGLRLQDVRQVKIEDLLGRESVQTDLAAVQTMLHGRRVLVTGAGGSIGAEIARQVARAEPSLLMLLDHDETHLHDLTTTLRADHVAVLADIRDRERLLRLLDKYRPEVVFHAAAHKHVPMLEEHPSEAVRTNVLGTKNLLDAAIKVGVDRFVLISTDKAVHPSSVMGASKRLAEYLTIGEADDGHRPFCAVRFGNVLGSRGSVVPTFVRQIEDGGPVTVTDPDMTRYFMSVPEAVQLVLQAAALSRGGEVFMLEMGEPIRIFDLARRMIRLSGRRVGSDVEIRVVGVRPGEKLHEELHLPAESPQPTEHPAVRRLTPERFSAAAMEKVVAQLRDDALIDDDQGVRRLLFEAAESPEQAAAGLALGELVRLDLTERETWSRSTF